VPGVTVNDRQENLVHPDVSFGEFQVTSGTGVQQGVSVFVDSLRVNEPAVEEVNFDLIPWRTSTGSNWAEGRQGCSSA
jgi:hypothetical protein